MREICQVCGCGDIRIISAKDKRYKCNACDSIFTLANDDERVQSPSAQNLQTPKAVYAKNIESILEVMCNFDDIESNGTAFCVSKNGYFVTNAHVLIDATAKKPRICNEIYVCKSRSNDFASAELVYIDPHVDLALLRVQGDIKPKPIQISTKPLEIGDAIVVIGNSKGEGLTLLDGIVGDTGRKYKSTPAFVFNALVTHGCSGAPVFNLSGEVCGVTVGGAIDAAGLNYAISVASLREFISTASSTKSLAI